MIPPVRNRRNDRHLARCPILAMLLVLLYSVPAFAGVVYVNKSAPGSTHNGSSWGTAFLTVKAGLTAALSGDEVWVAKATYTETLTLPAGVSAYGGFTGNETDLSQRNWVTNTTIIDGNGDTAAIIVSSAATGGKVDGFTFRNGGNGIKGTAGNIAVANCTFTGNAFATHLTATTAILSNCTVSSNTRGVYVYAGSVVTVNNCILSGNTASGVYVVTGGTTNVSNCLSRGNNYGIVATGGTARVLNSTINGNVEGVYINGGAVTVINSNVTYNTNGISGASPSTPVTMSFNNVFGNTTANYKNVTNRTGTNGNISEDPLYVNRTGADFHLAAGSPCIDAGDDSSVTPGTFDLDGQPRIQGAGVDMGAYESKPAGFSVTDARNALRFAAGLAAASAGDVTQLNVESGSPGLDILDAVRIARKAAGVDVNP